jgi:hypothetical protein
MNNQVRNLRQVRYNLETDVGEQIVQRHSWYFFIINTIPETERIKQRIITSLSICNELVDLDIGVIISRHSLHGRLITFKSEKGQVEDFSKIYDSSKIYKDRDLRKMNDVTFSRYVQRFIL